MTLASEASTVGSARFERGCPAGRSLRSRLRLIAATGILFATTPMQGQVGFLLVAAAVSWSRRPPRQLSSKAGAERRTGW